MKFEKALRMMQELYSEGLISSVRLYKCDYCKDAFLEKQLHICKKFREKLEKEKPNGPYSELVTYKTL